MSDEEEVNIETRESEPVAPEKEVNFEKTVETLETEAVGDIKKLEDTGNSELDAVQENGGSVSEVSEMEKVVEETTSEAGKTKEVYEEEIERLKDVPSWEDKQEGFRKTSENGIEEPQSNIPNLDDRESTKDFVVESVNKDEIKHIKEELESINELNGIDEKRKKLQEAAGKILNLSKGEASAFKSADMKELVALMNAISDKIDSESNAETAASEKPQLEKTKIEDSVKENAGKAEGLSVREFIQKYYDDFSARIKEVVESNLNYSEKFDALDKLSDELREQLDFVRNDILKTDEAKEVLDSLKREFSRAKEDIKESVSGKDSREIIQNSAKTVENDLKNLELSEETVSGKISAVKGISNIFELTIKICKDVIDSDEALKSMVNDKREMIKTAIQNLEKKQATKDVEAKKKGLG